MAWFGGGLTSLSNLKGQITSFTKDVLSEGAVEEIDDRARELKEVNERCVQLQELLNSKDAEISFLRRHNCKLQKVVDELNLKTKDSSDAKQDDDAQVLFSDLPTSVKSNRNTSNQNQARQLQEQLSQATMRIRELEIELRKTQKVSNSNIKDEMPDGHQKTEFLRAKQDMMNRIIQMEEKNQEAERCAKRMQLDETALINDFRTVISKLQSMEKLDLVRGALQALETENEEQREKSDSKEKIHESSNGIAADVLSNREVQLTRKIAELQNENKNLFANIEELDRQNSESIETLLSIKQDIEKKHQCLQNVYEQLYVDYNEAQEKITQLQNKLTSPTTTSPITPHKTTIPEKFDVSVQTINTQTETKDTATSRTSVIDEQNNGRSIEVRDSNETTPTTDIRENGEVRCKTNDTYDELELKIRGILKNCHVESTDLDETIFESLAKRYVEDKWKRDVLERKLTEITRELKDTRDMKDSLQMECDDMQAHIDSLMLDIQHLKSNLPSIPEASEERVASLETETESLQEDVSRLQAENDTLRKQNLELSRDSQGIRTDDDTEKDTDNAECTFEDLKSRLHALISENNDLRAKIDLLENSEKQMKEQLRISTERHKSVNEENLEMIEKLKYHFEGARCELDISTSSVKQLQQDIAMLQDTKSEIKRENEELFQKNEQLETELLKLRETYLQREDNDMLQDFHASNTKKDLGDSWNNVNSINSQVTQLTLNNERLIEENATLLKQLNDDLLNGKSIKLEQENADLQKEAILNQEKLNEVRANFHKMEEKYEKLSREYSCLESKLAEYRSKNNELHDSMKKFEDLERELLVERSSSNELNLLQNEKEQLEFELNILRSREKELLEFYENKQRSSDLKELDNKVQYLKEECQRLKIALESLEMEKNKVEETLIEKQQIITILEAKTKENETLKGDNNSLIIELTELQRKLESNVEANEEASGMAKETIENLSHIVKSKDDEINSLKSELALINDIHRETSQEFLTVQNERDELLKLVQIKHTESVQYHEEIQRLTQLLSNQASQIQNLLVEQKTSATSLKDKEAELLWTQNELQVVQQRLNNFEKSNNYGEVCEIAKHSTLASEVVVLNEKCNALEAALIQEQTNSRMLQNQLNESQSKEAVAAKELDRLRTHLVEMEASYTEEALMTEEIRKELETKLSQAEEKLKNSSTVYTSASIRANQQVETLQQQMSLIIQQRDDIQSKLCTAEEKILSQSASLTNLQIVLEQFQREKERDIKVATAKFQYELDEAHKRNEDLSNDISNLMDQLAEAKGCLQAASRLSELLDRKTEKIDQLNEEVEKLTKLVNTADERIGVAMQSGVGKVDKSLMKNLLLGYISASATDKSSVLRVFATVLDFNETEKDKAGLNNVTAQGGWFSRIADSSSAPNKDQEASLSAAFVRFLESESKPKPQLPALPISSTSSPRPTHSRQHSSSSTHSTLLLSNVTLPTFPDFIPARNTGSILKEVLKDS